MYFESDPEFVGAIPIRQDIEILPADGNKCQFHDNIIITSKGKIGLRGKVKPLILGMFTNSWSPRIVISKLRINFDD